MSNDNIKIAMAQLNFTVGDFSGNTDKILKAIDSAGDTDAILFTELAMSGYAPMDLVYEPWFMASQHANLTRILDRSVSYPGLIVIGAVTQRLGPGKPLANSLLFIQGGQIKARYDKKLLPTYDVFDERRYFDPGTASPPVLPIGRGEIRINAGFVLCEDGWNDQHQAYAENPVKELNQNPLDIIISINASPSNIGKRELRHEVFGSIARKYGKPVLYVNQVGGNDQVIYDGASFVAKPDGSILEAAMYMEGVTVVEIANGQVVKTTYLNEPEPLVPPAFHYEQIRKGLIDYLAKTGFKRVIVGSSGGIDSAVTLALAADILGPDNVEAVTMPSAYSSAGSVNDSKTLCDRLEVQLYYHSIREMVDREIALYKEAFGVAPSGLALENLQARIRGLILMTRSNQTGAMLLTTGNKSELSVGYATLYGDMSGGLNLIGDLYKTEVYALAQYINEREGLEIIPRAIIEKAPSAELAPGQRDDDSLPPYEILDALLKLLIERDQLPREEREQAENTLGRLDADERQALVARVSGLVAKAEFKRRQAPPVIRCRSVAFGQGRQMPIACKWGG